VEAEGNPNSRPMQMLAGQRKQVKLVLAWLVVMS
jgi:hypothetical protein